MTTLRRYCIKNDNLAAVFDQLGLVALLEPTSNGNSDSVPVLERKNKADIVEAIIGEIAEHRPEEDVLSELVAFISYIGEKEYFKEHHNHVLEPFSSRNSKRTQPRNIEQRTNNNNNSYHHSSSYPNQDYHNNYSNTKEPTNSPPPNVLFINNPTVKNTTSPQKRNVVSPIPSAPIAILKRETPNTTNNTANNNTMVNTKVVENRITSVNSSESSSGSGSPRLYPIKMSSSEHSNAFLRINQPIVPNMTATRTGVNLKEKPNF